jgi:hypothetical protein
MVIDLLKNAMEKISASYINLPVADNSQLKFRERVYCYELYHQLRVAQGLQQFAALASLQAAGEPDKAGHQLAEKYDLSKVKPDFIIHLPGNMGKNFLVGEVKPVVAGWKSIAADICKLAKFTDKEKMNYSYGVFVLFGERNTREQTILRRLKRAFNSIPQNLNLDRNRIECFWHTAVNVVRHYSNQIESFV